VCNAAFSDSIMVLFSHCTRRFCYEYFELLQSFDLFPDRSESPCVITFGCLLLLAFHGFYLFMKTIYKSCQEMPLLYSTLHFINSRRQIKNRLLLNFSKWSLLSCSSKKTLFVSEDHCNIC
jgi:hypothetical protein